jgi:hypothetical protein
MYNTTLSETGLTKSKMQDFVAESIECSREMIGDIVFLILAESFPRTSRIVLLYSRGFITELIGIMMIENME